MTTQLNAQLRVCASCEWIFKQVSRAAGVYGKTQSGYGCPKCQFTSYGARYVYGNKAYRYAETQEPWMDRKLATYTGKLLDEIEASKP